MTKSVACLAAAGSGFPKLLHAESSIRRSQLGYPPRRRADSRFAVAGGNAAPIGSYRRTPTAGSSLMTVFSCFTPRAASRGIDDDRSICYQIRSGDYDGPILKEGHLSRCVNDWDAEGTGKKYIKQHGHPVVFGVPKGAVIGGKTPAHANVFVIKWRVIALLLDEKGEVRADMRGSQRIGQGVESVQIRLNDDGNDLEIIQPAATMRQVGFEAGAVVCNLPRYGWMNQTYVNAVPFNDTYTEWVDVNHFAGDRIAALRYRFNADKCRYEWIETGPWLVDPKGKISEASVLRWKDAWIVATRLSGCADQRTRPARCARHMAWDGGGRTISSSQEAS